MHGQGCSARLAAVGAGERGLGAWGLLYALYCGYYAVGGTLLLPGRPADPAQFRLINAVAAVILVIAGRAAGRGPAAVADPEGPVGAARSVLGGCGGCCVHALIDTIQRMLSLAGLLRIEYSPTVWAWIDRRAADLQDLLFNEPWFLVEGLGFGALGWMVLGSGRRRRWWVGSAITAISVLTVIGMVSATGVIGKTIIG